MSIDLIHLCRAVQGRCAQWTGTAKCHNLFGSGSGATMPRGVRSVCIVAIASVLSAAAADAASVKDLFESHDLLGIWSLDCQQPVSENNPFVVFRPVQTFVQRDTMASATDRTDASIIDAAEETKPNEITMSMVSEPRRLKLVVRLEPKRMRTMEIAAENGEKFVADGRLVSTGDEVPWSNKCAGL